MNLFGEDMIIGDFKLSDYGLILASFEKDSGTGEDELGMDYETIEEFVGDNPVPVYLGAKYSNKLKPTATIIKNPCNNGNLYFTEHECRDILRQLTGFYGYKQMYILTDEPDELLYYNVRIYNVSYQKIGGNVAGIILHMECDSQFAWSKEYNYTYEISAGEIIKFYNTSDMLYDYLKPIVTITAKTDIPELNIKNIRDNNWTTTLSNLTNGETITMNSKLEKLSSSNGRNILDDFNMHFIRFVSGINEIEVDSDITLNISFRYPRKVGFL